MQAFEGIRVLDLTHVLAGPFSTYQLAVLGADVIKIEPIDNPDMNREIGAVESLSESLMGSHFQSQGGNKRAITLNLKSERGREIFCALAKTADVIVENFRAGALDRLGLGYEDISIIKPDIIYCSITGFGQTGPKRGHGAFDNIIQAYSGMMESTGPAHGDAVMVGPPVLDYGTGAQAAFAISSALFRRERTGEGQWIDIAMLDSALMMMASSALNVSLTGQVPKRSARGRDFIAAYGCYDTADGQLMVGVVTPIQHSRLWQALGRDDLSIEVDQQSVSDMPEHQSRDEALLTEILKTRSASEWEDMLNDAGVPVARVRTLNEALASEQIASRTVLGAFSSTHLPQATPRPAVAAFMCSSDGPNLHSAPAQLGEHTDEVLNELGYDTQTVQGLRVQGVI